MAEMDDLFGTAEEGTAEGETEGGEDDDEGNPLAESFGLKLGVPLGVILLGWAFVGPGHLLTTGRFELPILASFRQPFRVEYLAYVAATTFAFAFAGGLVFPWVFDDDGPYESSLAINLVLPAVAITVLLAVVGLVFPALFYVVTGDVVRAGLVLGMAVVVVVVALIFRLVAMLVVGIWSAPLWLSSFAGVYTGSYLRRGLERVGVGA